MLESLYGNEKIKLPIDSYAWRLEAAIWVPKSPRDSDEVRCRPRLLLVNRSWDDHLSCDYHIIGFIEYDLGSKVEGRASWLVYFYPKDKSGLWRAIDETKYYDRQVLAHGEKRDPRDSANAALKHLLELAAGDIPHPEFSSLEKVGSHYLPILQEITNMYARRHGQHTKQLA